MPDTQKLLTAIRIFENNSHNCKASNAPATVQDINDLAENTAKILRTIVSELENNK